MADIMFTLVFPLAAPFWFLMIVLPTWRWTPRIVASPLIALPAAAIYVVLLIPQLDVVFPAVASPNLTGVAELIGTADGAALAWAHFIAFDLFVGAWIYRDARNRRIHPLIMAPILFLTILVAPAGFAVYLGIRMLGRRRGVDGAETATAK